MKKYRVEYTTRFTKQIQELYDYIVFQYQNPYDAMKLITAIMKKCKGLNVFPNSNGVRKSYGGHDYRFAHVGHHTIIYEVNDEKHVVTIWGLMYSRRDILGLIESM